MRRLLFFVDFSHIQGSRTKGCFEVVLEGEEGRFIEDPEASDEGEVGTFSNWVGFGDVRSSEKLTAALIEFFWSTGLVQT